MANQKILKTPFVAEQVKRLKAGKIDPGYLGDGLAVKEEDVFEIPGLGCPDPDELKLISPTGEETHDFENALRVFEAFKDINWTQATDARLWTHLSLVTYWDFLKKRRPITSQPEAKRSRYILRHYFVAPVNARNLLLNDIALFWWGTYLTLDSQRADPYELTRELFSMLDYTRHLLPGTQGRNRTFTHAVLEFVLENSKLFSEYKEAKVRFIMRKCNYMAGYRVFPNLQKGEIKDILSNYKTGIELAEATEKKPDDAEEIED